MANGRIIALGYFDGVHMGHGGLLRKAAEMAKDAGLSPAAVTFSPHPSALLTGKSLPLISSEEDRKKLMQRLYGIEELLIIPFDRAMMTMPWEAFLEDVILGQFSAKGLVCGHDFRFGFKGEGTAEKLKEFCEKKQLPCAVIDEISLDGTPVSSTLIRNLLAEGGMEKAVRFLGHPHLLTAPVVAGHRRGRTWGIPTANLPFPEGTVVPAYGVYVTRVTVDGKSYPAVTNVGVHPTVGTEDTPFAEAWLLNFEGDLYGKTVELQFYHRLRGEKKFPSVEALAEEIRRNAQEVREYFEK